MTVPSIYESKHSKRAEESTGVRRRVGALAFGRSAFGGKALRERFGQGGFVRPQVCGADAPRAGGQAAELERVCRKDDLRALEYHAADGPPRGRWARPAPGRSVGSARGEGGIDFARRATPGCGCAGGREGAAGGREDPFRSRSRGAQACAGSDPVAL